MTNHSTPALEKFTNTKENALQRVVALGRQWLSDAPEQLLSHFKRQAEQLLELRAELQAYQAQLQECQAELEQLREEQRRGHVAPFRRQVERSTQPHQRPGRKPGHPGEW